MNAIIYTKSDAEYEAFARMLKAEIPGMEIDRDPDDGQYHFEKPYDLVVDALDGALGMEIALGYRERYHQSMVIWITDDRYFVRMAIHSHIFDFHVRPVSEETFLGSLRYFTSGEIEPWKLGDPRADWACGCTVQELAGMCPVIQRFLKDREAAK